MNFLFLERFFLLLVPFSVYFKRIWSSNYSKLFDKLWLNHRKFSQFWRRCWFFFLSFLVSFLLITFGWLECHLLFNVEVFFSIRLISFLDIYYMTSKKLHFANPVSIMILNPSSSNLLIVSFLSFHACCCSFL